MDVLVIVVAIELINGGAAIVGGLSSAAGVGGIIGAAAAVALVGRSRLAGPFALGLLVWGIPIGLLGIAPGLVAGVLLFLVAGAGRGALDVAGRTLLQRVTPDAALLGRVRGRRECLHGDDRGRRDRRAAADPVARAAAAIDRRRVVAADHRRRDVADAQRRRRASASSMFASWSCSVRSRCSRRSPRRRSSTCRRTSCLRSPAQAPGSSAKATPATGSTSSTRATSRCRSRIASSVDRAPASSFGEIALLRDVPRTASVRAVSAVTLLALERDVFLAAVAGHAPSRTAADAVVAERLGSG